MRFKEELAAELAGAIKLPKGRKVKVYLARAMTGRVKAEVVAEAEAEAAWWRALGFEVLCPVTKEGIKASNDVLIAAKSDMKIFWPLDKQMIRDADVVVDTTPHRLSQGVIHELGLARYCYWKPVVRIFPPEHMPPESSIAFFEDDVVVSTALEAVKQIYSRWGTWLQRLIWRFVLLLRSVPRFSLYQFQFIINVF